MIPEAFAAALVHSLWQGAAIAGFVWALGRARSSTAAVRCGLGLAGLGALALTVGLTARLITEETAAALSGLAAQGPVSATLPGPLRTMAAAATSLDAYQAGFPVAAPWLIGGWAAVSLILLARLAAGVVCAQRLRRTGGGSTTGLEPVIKRLAAVDGGRAPATMSTNRVDVPGTVGVLHPVILVPPTLAQDVSAMELEALLAHELAHVRRYDWAINVVQSVVDALLWFHPAAWWMSARARAEREFACDDFAARLCGDPAPVARALAQLETSRLHPVGLVASAARGPLIDRIRRLVGPTAVRPRRMFRSAGLAAGLILCLGGWVTVGVLPGSATSRLMISTIRAIDQVGPFTVTLREGRPIAATIDGVVVPAERLSQRADSVYVLDDAGDVELAVRLTPGGGISWQGRAAVPERLPDSVRLP